MKGIFIIIFVNVVLLVNVNGDGFQSTLGHLKSQTNEATQSQAVLDLIKRLIPKRASEFYVKINKKLGPVNKDTFKIIKESNGVINITASSGVAAAWAFNHYLKYSCKAHVSWETTQLYLPADLPHINITVTSNDRFRYYQNVCTTSYSFVWWNWNDWEKHIDWMAMNSINLVLAFNGQEAIWKRVYRKLNLTEEEINDHFAGPAFLSWSRMGNIRGWAGPLSDSWHKRSLVLQKQILKRMRDFGIMPVLPAFAGHVPRAFKRIYPNAKLAKLNTWNKFEDKYCCPFLLDPTDPVFKLIGNSFMIEQIHEFGTDHVYNCDTFNEMTPTSGDLNFLRNISRSIYSAMTDIDPKAIWILQNWLFVHDILFWNKERVKALLTPIPVGHMIVLDLQSEQFPQYQRFDSYFGQPFIWCMLHNFGGTLGLFGSADKINKNTFSARNFANSSMIGIGLTPEGINQNYVIYDLMLEMSWRKTPADLSNWFAEYAVRRYGYEEENAIKAWNIMKDTVYNYSSILKMRGKYVISRSPKLNLNAQIWYNSTRFMEAWHHLLLASDKLGNNSAYRHDLVDVTRQALQIFGDLYYQPLVKAFRNKRIKKFNSLRHIFNQIFIDVDSILSTNEAFLLGRWIQSAKAAANTVEDARLFEYNAKNQITLWGPRGEIKDYATKQWAGIVSHLFGPRWKLFTTAMYESLTSMQPFNESSVADRIFKEIEVPFTEDRTIFPVNVTGDSIEIARDIHAKWRNRTTIHMARGRKRADRVQRSSDEMDEPRVITL